MLPFKQMLLAGFGAILAGFFGALGWDIYLAGKEAVSVSIVGSSIPVHLLVFGAIAIAGLALLISALWKNRSEKKTIDPRFAHLTIHYSQRTDTPDTPNPARPRLVVDNRRKRYYWVSTWLEPYIRQHKINWHTHDGEKALRTWLKKEKIEPHETDPTLEEFELGNLLETDSKSKEKMQEKKQASQLADISIANSPSQEAVNDLLERLSFFINNWNVYRDSIQARNLTSPQNGEVKWTSDQIKSAIVKIRLLKLRKINEEPLILIESTANNMAKLGMGILETYPSRGYVPADIESKTIDDLVKREDILCKNTKQIIRKVGELL